jgi:hypothetical protein
MVDRSWFPAGRPPGDSFSSSCQHLEKPLLPRVLSAQRKAFTSGRSGSHQRPSGATRVRPRTVRMASPAKLLSPTLGDGNSARTHGVGCPSWRNALLSAIRQAIHVHPNQYAHVTRTAAVNCETAASPTASKIGGKRSRVCLS